jgi:hypothetical protein
VIDDDLSKRKEVFGVPFRDLAGEGVDEDTRIRLIGNAVVGKRQTVAVLVDSEPGKADRYVCKLAMRFPSITEWDIKPGPSPGCTTIRIFPPSTAQKNQG